MYDRATPLSYRRLVPSGFLCGDHQASFQPGIAFSIDQRHKTPGPPFSSDCIAFHFAGFSLLPEFFSENG
jgi:hypothetical protein